MRFCTLLLGWTALIKGVWLLVHPKSLERVSRGFTRLVPGSARGVVEGCVGGAWAMAAQLPGGVRTAAWVAVFIGLWNLRQAHRTE